jgi:hypothetical protein
MKKLISFASEQPLDNDTQAYYAQQIIENPLYAEVIAKIEKDCTAKWQSTPFNDVEMREQMYLHLRVLKQIDSFIRNYVVSARNGKILKQYSVE